MSKKVNDKPDPKYLGIPNICFSLTDEKDSREGGFAKQRKERGFDNSETWSLFDTIVRFSLPRLKVFAESASWTHPYGLGDKRWKKILDDIIIAFELIIRNDGSCIWNKKEEKQVEKGLDLFREYFFNLWN